MMASGKESEKESVIEFLLDIFLILTLYTIGIVILTPIVLYVVDLFIQYSNIKLRTL
jgi:hypothetical protein